jgi:lysophospholipase L1-like esterase
MWGTGVDDLNTIPAQFNALHKDYRVYNHGESGFVSRQEVGRLINLVNQNSPMDVVIFYDGCNDCRSLCRSDVSIDYARKVASTLVNNWKIAKTVAALGGAEFHAFLQPVAAIGQPNIEYLKERGDDTDWNKVYPFIREIQARENLVWIHDLSDAFDVDEYIYIDGCHVNGRGNQIIAKRISESLNSLELSKAAIQTLPVP